MARHLNLGLKRSLGTDQALPFSDLKVMIGTIFSLLLEPKPPMESAQVQSKWLMSEFIGGTSFAQGYGLGFAG